eukprot:3128500-Karenia_brevis.AAC.1
MYDDDDDDDNDNDDEGCWVMADEDFEKRDWQPWVFGHQLLSPDSAKQNGVLTSLQCIDVFVGRTRLPVPARLPILA